MASKPVIKRTNKAAQIPHKPSEANGKGLWSSVRRIIFDQVASAARVDVTPSTDRKISWFLSACGWLTPARPTVGNNMQLKKKEMADATNRALPTAVFFKSCKKEFMS